MVQSRDMYIVVGISGATQLSITSCVDYIFSQACGSFFTVLVCWSGGVQSCTNNCGGGVKMYIYIPVNLNVCQKEYIIHENVLIAA